MEPETVAWLKAGHLIGVVLWIGGLVSVYWMLRFHVHAPKESHEKLTLMERSLAMMMDIAATLAIGCGLVSALGQDPNLFTRPGSGYFHIKLLVVVVGVLSVHGMLRARIKKFGMGKIKDVPGWQWSLLLGSIVAILILVTRVKLAMCDDKCKAWKCTQDLKACTSTTLPAPTK
jgi:uncharacterized membrane protein